MFIGCYDLENGTKYEDIQNREQKWKISRNNS